MNKFKFLYILICFSIYAKAQEAKSILQQVITPAPNASSLGKYGDIPVSLYTGIPNISVPIYQINSGILQIPISLSYHAAGIKVEEIASSVGLGWSLNAGGVIARTIRGLADEQSPYGYLNNNLDMDVVLNYNLTQKVDIYNQANNNEIDLQPDIFNFNFAGKSGKFLIDRQTKKGYSLNNNDKLDISWDILNSAWIITDGLGIKYYFGISKDKQSQAIDQTMAELSSNISLINNPNIIAYPTAWYLLDIVAPTGETIHFSYSGTTLSYCQKAQETDYFLYGCSNSDGSYCTGQSPSKFWNKMIVANSQLTTITFPQGQIVFNYKSEKRLDLYSEGRYGDYALESINIFNYLNSTQSIKKFVLETSYFTSSLGSNDFCTDGISSNYRLRLNAVKEYSGTNYLPGFEFTYRSDALPNRFSNAQDYWGFYNGVDNQTLVPEYLSPIPDNLGGFVILTGANRKPNLNSMAGILTEIKYPTGGKTSFEYELHDAYMKDFSFELPLADSTYAYVAKDEMGEIYVTRKDFHIDGPFNAQLNKYGLYVKITTYAEPCDNSLFVGGCGGNVSILQMGSSVNAWQYHQNTPNQTIVKDIVFLENGDYRITMRSTGDLNDLHLITCLVDVPKSKDFYNKPIGGLRIKKVSNFDVGVNTQTTSYRYKQAENSNNSSGILVSQPVYGYSYQRIVEHRPPSNPSLIIIVTNNDFARTASTNVPLGLTQGSHIGYSYVEEIKGTDTQNYPLGKTSYKYTTSQDYPDNIEYSFPFRPATSYDWRRGLLLENKEFKYTNGVFSLVKMIKNSYVISDSRYHKQLDGIHMGNNVTFNGQIISGQPANLVFTKYSVISEWLWQDSQEIKIYDSNDIDKFSKTIINYSYDNPNHLQLTKTEQILNSNEKRITKYKYPLDYNVGVNTGIDNLNTNHIILAAIEEQTWQEKSGVQTMLSGKITEYDPLTFKPKSIYLLKTVSPLSSLNNETQSGGKYNTLLSDSQKYIQKAKFAYSSQSNLIEQQKVSIAFTTDAQGNLIPNIQAEDIKTAYLWAYGNTYPIAQVINASSTQIYHTSFEEETTGITNNGAKTGLKYWSTSSYTIPSAKRPTNTANLVMTYWWRDASNVWQFQPETTYSSSISKSGATGLDEIRVYPKGAQMSTYTYTPLIGMTSQTDVNNQSMYYEYDGFGRLILIKDEKGNILKQQIYHYKGQN